MIYNLISVLVVIVCVLMVLIVLVQNSKGGGLASNFQSSNQFMGVLWPEFNLWLWIWCYFSDTHVNDA